MVFRGKLRLAGSRSELFFVVGHERVSRENRLEVYRPLTVGLALGKLITRSTGRRSQAQRFQDCRTDLRRMIAPNTVEEFAPDAPRFADSRRMDFGTQRTRAEKLQGAVRCTLTKTRPSRRMPVHQAIDPSPDPTGCTVRRIGSRSPRWRAAFPHTTTKRGSVVSWPLWTGSLRLGRSSSPSAANDGAHRLGPAFRHRTADQRFP